MTNKTDNEKLILNLSEIFHSKAECYSTTEILSFCKQAADALQAAETKLAAIREAAFSKESLALALLRIREIINTTNAQPAEKQQDEYCAKCGGAGFIQGEWHCGITEIVSCPCTKPAQEQGGKG